MRLFFAIWPDESTRNRLEDLAKRFHRECGGKKTGRESIHLTLVFLGEVENIDPLREAASKISESAFDIRIDLAGYWKHNRILWAGTSAIPKGLGDLVAALREKLKAAGFGFDARDYFTHVTLLRKAFPPGNAAGFEPFSWRVQEFCLVGSSDSGYVVMGRWALKVDAALEMPA